jgi:glutathione S-transferase
MSLTFYWAPNSTAGITELVLEELGVRCERVSLDISKGDTKKPDFLKLNPNAKVPVLVHDGTVIWESAAISMYLGETFGVEKKLYPAPGPQRGEAMKWIVWTNVTLGDAVGRFTRNTMDWHPADQQNAKAGEAAKKEVADCLRILDEALRSKQFLLGDYTLADAHLNGIIGWLKHLKIDFAPFPEVQAWNQRCSARPAYVKVTGSSQ